MPTGCSSACMKMNSQGSLEKWTAPEIGFWEGTLEPISEAVDYSTLLYFAFNQIHSPFLHQFRKPTRSAYPKCTTHSFQRLEWTCACAWLTLVWNDIEQCSGKALNPESELASEWFCFWFCVLYDQFHHLRASVHGDQNLSKNPTKKNPILHQKSTKWAPFTPILSVQDHLHSLDSSLKDWTQVTSIQSSRKVGRRCTSKTKTAEESATSDNSEPSGSGIGQWCGKIKSSTEDSQSKQAAFRGCRHYV